MQLPRADCVVKIDLRTMRIAGLVCGFSAAIAPIDAGWSQCSVQEVSSPTGSGRPGFLVNGQPATLAQVKQCEQCNSGAVAGPACAKLRAAAEQQSEAQSERKNCAANPASSACARSRKAAAAIDNAKHQAVEQKEQ